MSKSTISTYQLFEMVPDAEAGRPRLESRLGRTARAARFAVWAIGSRPARAAITAAASARKTSRFAPAPSWSGRISRSRNPRGPHDVPSRHGAGGDDHRALSRPFLLDRHDPVFQDAGPLPFLDEPEDTLVADPVLQEADDPLLGNLREERPDVGVENVVHLSAADPDDQRIQRIMLAASWPEPVRGE